MCPVPDRGRSQPCHQTHRQPANAARHLSPRELIPTVRYDTQAVRDATGPLERFSRLPCEVLLLGGSKSARDLTASLDGLRRVLPRAKRVVLRGAGHTAPDNSRHPDRVAAELRAFFSR